MNINKKMDTIKEIYNRLLGADSKMIFEKRSEYVFDRNYKKLVNKLWNIIKDKSQRSPQLEKSFEGKSRINAILMAQECMEACKRSFGKVRNQDLILL